MFSAADRTQRSETLPVHRRFTLARCKNVHTPPLNYVPPVKQALRNGNNGYLKGKRTYLASHGTQYISMHVVVRAGPLLATLTIHRLIWQLPYICVYSELTLMNWYPWISPRPPAPNERSPDGRSRLCGDAHHLLRREVVHRSREFPAHSPPGHLIGVVSYNDSEGDSKKRFGGRFGWRESAIRRESRRIVEPPLEEHRPPEIAIPSTRFPSISTHQPALHRIPDRIAIRNRRQNPPRIRLSNLGWSKYTCNSLGIRRPRIALESPTESLGESS